MNPLTCVTEGAVRGAIRSCPEVREVEACGRAFNHVLVARIAGVSLRCEPSAHPDVSVSRGEVTACDVTVTAEGGRGAGEQVQWP